MSNKANTLLRRSAWRHMRRHPWLVFFSVFGVALGVAVVTAIDLVNYSAQRSFTLANEMISGRTTHEITAGPAGVPESLYIKLRVKANIRSSAPVAEGQVVIDSLPGQAFVLLGVDPLAEPSVRSYQTSLQGQTFLTELLTVPGAVMMSETTAEHIGLQLNDKFAIRVDGTIKTLRLVGFLRPANPAEAQAMASMLLVDIATSQDFFNRYGRLTRIELVLDGPDRNELLEKIRDFLPPEVQLIQRKRADDVQAQMTEAFRINLRAMSLLALLVGAFIVFNTMSFSVLQRRRLFGLQRALGVTGKQIWRGCLTEAAFIGLLGAVLGLLMGIALADNLLDLVTRTINDLYYSMPTSELHVSAWGVIKLIALGVGVTLLAAVPPTWEATRAPPRAALSRSYLEQKSRYWVHRLAIVGGVCFFLGATIVIYPSDNLIIAFVGLFLLVIGYALTIPQLVKLIISGVAAKWPHGKAMIAHMAFMGVNQSLSRTGVAMAALMVAIATTVGVSIMIYSFRASVVTWVAQSLRADVYVSVTDQTATQSRGIPQELINSVRSLSDVKAVSLGRTVRVPVNERMQDITALDLPREGFNGFKLLTHEKNPWQMFQHGNAVLVSEPYANRYQVSSGDIFRLPTAEGMSEFIVAGIFRDYSNERGRIAMRRSLYAQLWHDPLITNMGLYLRDESKAGAVVNEVRHLLPADMALRLRSNAEIRNASIEIFDRTFAITDVLRVITLLVAVVGILTALMALQLERAREFAVLRATGMTPRQLFRLVTVETSVMGLIAGLLAVPLGVVLASVLINVINYRAFGWSLEMTVNPQQPISALILALLAAVSAGLYPARHMSRTPPGLALREE